MGTPFDNIYDLFLARIEQDEWAEEMGDDLDLIKEDWFQFLQMAINRFMFPRVSLELDKEKECFNEELGQQEMQLLAVFMKNEWLKRQVASWKLIQQQYHTKDFEFLSQANHLDKLLDLLDISNKECLNMTNLYSRVQDHKPFDYNQLAGGKRE